MNEKSATEILLIARNFPPFASPGYVIRVLKFCKFLPYYGFKPIVVTVNKKPARIPDPHRDPLLEEIADSTEIHYVPESRLVRFVETISIRKRKLRRIRKRSMKYLLLSIQYVLLSGIVKNLFHVMKKWFLIPDEAVLWNEKAEALCSELIRARKIQYVMTTSPNNSTHLIGMELKKRFPIRWCADFRDAWVGNPLFRSTSALRNKREERQEKRVIEAADIVTSVNDPIVELLKEHADTIAGKRFETIYNGFDMDELAVPAHLYDPHSIHMIHCGVLFSDRNLGPFMRVALDMAAQGKPFCIHLLGRVEDPGCFEFHRQYPERIQLYGIASRGTTISMIKGADVALVVQSDRYFAPLSGKIFEYLACDKRVIGLVPEGIARDFIRDVGMGWSCDLADEMRIRAILEEVYQLWVQKRLAVHYPWEIKRRFDRKVSTGRLAELMRENETSI